MSYESLCNKLLAAGLYAQLSLFNITSKNTAMCATDVVVYTCNSLR